MKNNLADAIRAIPTGVRWEPGRALERFAHSALVGLVGHAHGWKGGGVFARCYAPVLAPLDRQTSREEAEALGRALSAYLDAVAAAEPFDDVLTQLHAHFLGHLGGNGLGQHFTPWDMAKLASAIVRDHRARHPNGRIENRLYEPCCGAGGLLLAQLQDWEGDTADLTVHATDLDPLCATMTALQLFANQVVHERSLRECVVTVGNVLLRQQTLAFVSVPWTPGNTRIAEAA